jgi:capsule polysaccharide export protein KpsC/LpsZ
MVDIDTFLTRLYVPVDDFCKQHLPAEPTPRRPQAPLSRSEVITLAGMGQWARFQSERDFYRFAKARRLPLLPTLPDLSQLWRLQRQHQQAILAWGLHLAQEMQVSRSAYTAYLS